MSAHIVEATTAHEACYGELMRTVKELAAKHDTLSKVEVVAILARTTGYTAAMLQPEDQRLGRMVVAENFNLGFADVTAMLHDAPSRQQ